MSKIFRDEVNADRILQRMWENQKFCDVGLIAGTEEIRVPAHRSVLCAASEYFDRMFTAPFNESAAREVKMPSVDGEILKTLVKYCYMRSIEIKGDNVEKLLEAANFLHFGFVVNSCGDFLADQLHPNNCFELTLMADRHHCESLLKKAKDFCLKHFVDFYKTDDFLELNSEQLGQLLSSDDLHVPREEEIFKGVMKWIEHNRSEREQNKEELFKLMRMPMMKPSFLIEHVKPLCNTFATLQLYTEAAEWHLFPKRRTNSISKSTEPRRYNQFLMAITREENKDTMNILYYCSETRKWMKWLEDLVYLEGFSAAVMHGNLYIVGGKIEGSIVNTVTCLNFETMTLKEIRPMNECRADASLAVLKGFLYVVGGTTASNEYLNSVEKWDSINNTWNTVAPMSVSRCNTGVTVFKDKLYVVGGCNVDGDLRLVECYNPEENVWVAIAPMHEARQYPGLTASNGMLYAISGDENETTERYNPDCDKWTMLCSLNEWIYGDLCILFDEKMLLLYEDRVEEYNLETNECKVNASINGLEDAYCAFSYSGGLSVEKFVENLF